jgi:hypothetical protein
VSTVELVGAEVRSYYWEFDVETLEYVETEIGTTADGHAKSNLFFHNYDFGVRRAATKTFRIVTIRVWRGATETGP